MPVMRKAVISKMKNTSESHSDFLKGLIDKSVGMRRSSASCFYSTDPSGLKEPGDLKSIICIEDEHLSEVAKKA